jgi:hypothetical protein
MTSTDKKVTRVTPEAYKSRFITGKPRRLAVTISGEYLIFRPYGTQRRYYFLILDACETAISRTVMAEKAQRRSTKTRRAK